MNAYFYKIKRTGEWGVELLFPLTESRDADHYRTKGKEYKVKVEKRGGDICEMKVTPYSYLTVQRRDNLMQLQDFIRIGCKIVPIRR